MVAPVILVEATPRLASDGSPVTVRLAGGGAEIPYHYGGDHWRAGLAGLPKAIASLDFDGEQLGGGGVPQALELAWSPGSSAAVSELAALYWTDAPIVVRIGPEGDAMPPINTTGLVLETAVEVGALRIALADQATDLKRPLLVDRFAGTGGTEGPSEFAGLIKSRVWGPCFNVPGRLIDQAYQIWCFGDPARAWQSFDQVRDKGVAAAPATLTVLSWQGSLAATFAALQAAVVIAGGGVRCPSIACVKWWTEPAGDLHADVRGEIAGGYVDTAPEIAARIVAARSTLPFAAGAIAAAAAARPAACGWRVDSDSTTAADVISELLGGVSLSWTIIDGAIEFRRWEWTASTRIARSHRVTRRSTTKPVTSRKLGYRRNWSPMARGDLAGLVLVQDVVYDDGQPIADAIVDAGTTAEWPKISDPDGTKADDNATNSADPNSPLGPDRTVGTALQLLDANAAGVALLGRADLSQDALIGQAKRDQATLAEALTRLTVEANRSRVVMRDAGVTIDPDSGTVRIYGVDQVAYRTSQVEIALNAATAQIALRATNDYVNQQIALAQLTPGQAADLLAIIARVTTAEVKIDGLTATVALKADAMTLMALSGVVTGVSQTLDALAGVVSTKASSTSVELLSTRVGAAEQTLYSLGNVSGITVAIRQAQLLGDGAAQASLRALLAGDDANRRQIVAQADARQELVTRIDDGLSAEATQRTLLSVQIGAIDARAGQEILARITADQAIAQQLDALSVTFGQQSATVTQLTQALITPGGGASAKAVLALDVNGRISGLVQTNNGSLARASFAADIFEVVHPVTGALLFYVDVNGAIVGRLKAGIVEADTIIGGAVTKTVFQTTTAPIVIAYG